MLQNVFDHTAKCSKPPFWCLKLMNMQVTHVNRKYLTSVTPKSQFLKWCDLWHFYIHVHVEHELMHKVTSIAIHKFGSNHNFHLQGISGCHDDKCHTKKMFPSPKGNTIVVVKVQLWLSWRLSFCHRSYRFFQVEEFLFNLRPIVHQKRDYIIWTAPFQSYCHNNMNPTYWDQLTALCNIVTIEVSGKWVHY